MPGTYLDLCLAPTLHLCLAPTLAVIHSDRDFATSRLCVTRLRLDMLENKNHGGRVLYVPSGHRLRRSPSLREMTPRPIPSQQSQRVKPSLRLCHLSPFPKPKGERTVLLWIASRRTDMMLTPGPRSRPSCSRTCRQFKMPLDGSVMREQWDGHEGLGHPCLTCVESTTRPRSSRSLRQNVSF